MDTIIQYILNYLKILKLLKSIFPCYITTGLFLPMLGIQKAPTRSNHCRTLWVFPPRSAPSVQSVRSAANVHPPLQVGWWGVVVQGGGGKIPISSWVVGTLQSQVGGGGKPSMHHVL